jgi:hypothetical protein
MHPLFLQTALPCLIERITVEPNDEVRNDMTEITVCLLQGLHTQNDTWVVVCYREMLLNNVTSHTERPRKVRYLDKKYTILHDTIIFALLRSSIPHSSPASVHCNEWVHFKSTISSISYTLLSSWNLNPRANECFIGKSVLDNHKLVCNKIH